MGNVKVNKIEEVTTRKLGRTGEREREFKQMQVDILVFAETKKRGEGIIRMT